MTNDRRDAEIKACEGAIRGLLGEVTAEARSRDGRTDLRPVAPPREREPRLMITRDDLFDRTYGKRRWVGVPARTQHSHATLPVTAGR